MATSIIVQIKKKKNNPELVTILIRGYYNRKSVVSLTTGQQIKLKDWDPVKREVLAKATNANMINLVIQNKLAEVKKRLMQVEIMGADINRQHVVNAVRNKDTSADFLQFCKDRIKQYSNKETRRTYYSEVTKLHQFKDTVSFADIDHDFLNTYKAYMEQVLENAQNTVWKSFKFMNTMIAKAIRMKGIILVNPFEQFNRGKYVQTKRNFLEISDCVSIEALTGHENEMIRKVAIYFLLMSYSGMRFSDAMRFDPDKHVVDGRIIMQYEKFDTDVNNKMFTRLAAIVELVRSNRLVLSNQKFNQWLKVVAGMRNIKANLSSHAGRHTMGGILAEMEIATEQAQIILGHKDIRATRIYYHMKNKSIDAAMDKLNAI